MGWAVVGSEPVFAELRGRLERAASERRAIGERAEAGGTRGYLKAGALRGRARVRHGLRGLLGRPLPRIAEHANLLWLADHGFRAARPVFAAALHAGALPRYQVLFTELVDGAADLAEHLARSDAAERAALAREVGAEVARLHAAGFLHRDLFARNLLVAKPVDGRRIVFLDAWRGGARRQLRGPAYDVACLLADADDPWSEGEVGEIVGAYLDGRRAAGWRGDGPRFLARVERARRAVRARETLRGVSSPAPPGREGP